MRTLTRDIATQMAYLIGIRDELLENNYAADCGDTLSAISENEDARIIRILCQLRATMMRKYEHFDSKLRYDMKNIDSIDFFNHDDIKWLTNHGVSVIQVNSTANKYLIKITQIIHERINTCKPLFPDWINWEFIRDLFVIPGCISGNAEKADSAIKTEQFLYTHNLLKYPFQMYIHWRPEECGNLLNTDRKFLTLLYKMNGSEFYDNSKVMDANDEVKGNIYDFIDRYNSTAIIVDCENSDVYKLYSVLKNLDAGKLSKIKKLILFDDYHTTNVWKLLEKSVNIDVEYYNVERVTDAKSLVDIKMTAGVCREFYENRVESFILVSSDSDFWGLISSLPRAGFLVMIEYDKCGDRIKNVLRNNQIYYCSIDDFCRGNIDTFKNTALRNEVTARITEFNETGIWQIMNCKEFIDDILKACRIEITPPERKAFIDKYIKNLRFKPYTEGNFCIEIQ